MAGIVLSVWALICRVMVSLGVLRGMDGCSIVLHIRYRLQFFHIPQMQRW